MSPASIFSSAFFIPSLDFKFQENIELPKQNIEIQYNCNLIPAIYKNIIEINSEKINKNAKNIEKIAITENYTVSSKIKEIDVEKITKLAEEELKKLIK